MCGILVTTSDNIDEELKILIKNRGLDHFTQEYKNQYNYLSSVLSVRGNVCQPLNNELFLLYNGEIYNEKISDTIFITNLFLNQFKLKSINHENSIEDTEVFYQEKWIPFTSIEFSLKNIPNFHEIDIALDNIKTECEMSVVIEKSNFLIFFKDEIGKRSLGFSFCKEIIISSVYFKNEADPKFIYMFSLEEKILFRKKRTNYFLKNLEKYLITPIHNNLCERDTIKNVKDILIKTLKRMTHEFNHVILFSGGVDSFLITVLLSKILENKKPIYLINTQFISKKLSKDRISGKLAYEELKIAFPQQKFHFVENDIDIEEYKKSQNHIQKLIYPKKSMMDLNIGACLHFSCKKAACYSKVVFLGSGADELFCGYNNHKEVGKCLKTSIYDDMSNIYERNLGRDDRVISDNNVEGRYPFLTKELITFVLNMNTKFLMSQKENGETVNKYILRCILKEEGFCRGSNLKKTAMQFGSGINYAEKKLGEFFL